MSFWWSFSESSKKWIRGISMKPHEAAAVLVQLAADGERSITKPYECTRERDCFYLRKKYQPEIRLAAWSLMILQFFERPQWTYFRDDWSDTDRFPSSNLPTVSDSIILPLYFLLLLVMGWAILLEAGYEIFGMVGGVTDTPGVWKMFSLPMKNLKGRKTPRLLLVFSLLVWTISMSQVIIAMICHASTSLQNRPFWVAPTMTSFIILAERSGSRRYSYLLRTIPKFIILIIVLVVVVFMFTTMAFFIFPPSSEVKDLYFDTFGDGLWNMMMILVGSNWPLPIIPAIHYNRLFFLFFFIFIMIVGWGFLNLVIGYIFSNLTTQRERSERLSQLDFKLNMIAAFSVLDEDAKQKVSVKSIRALLLEMRSRYMNYDRIIILSALVAFFHFMLLRCLTQKQVLDETEKEFKLRASSTLDRKRFTFSDDVNTLNEPLSSSHERSHASSARRASRMSRYSSVVFERVVLNDDISTEEMEILLSNLFCPQVDDVVVDTSGGIPMLLQEEGVDLNLFYEFPARCVGKEAYKLIKKRRLALLKELDIERYRPVSGSNLGRIVTLLRYGDSKYFDVAIDLILALFSVLILSGSAAVGVLIASIVIMFFESAVRLISKGGKRFFESFRNVTDTIVFVLLVIIVLSEIMVEGKIEAGNAFIRAVIVFRLLLLARNLTIFPAVDKFRKNFKTALKYCAKGAEDVFYLLLILSCLAFSFCELGVLAFGGSIEKIGSDGEKIMESDYGNGGYWPLNFNDFASGLGTLFTLLHVNNMHVTCSGFEAVMPAYKPRLFFLAWYFSSVLLLLNIIPAFLLNNFWKYYVDIRREKAAASDGLVVQKASIPQSPSSDSAFDQKVSFSTATSDVQILPSVTHKAHLDSIASAGMQTPSSKSYPASVAIQSRNNKRVLNENENTLTQNLLINEKNSGDSQPVGFHPSPSCFQRFLSYFSFGERVILRSQLAAILVQHAKEGSRPVLFSSNFACLCYLKRAKYAWLFKLVTWAFIVLCCFMRPEWTFLDSRDWENHNLYPRTSDYLSVQIGGLLSILFLCILMYGIMLEIIYNLELAKITGKTQLAACVAAAEGVPHEITPPIPTQISKGTLNNEPTADFKFFTSAATDAAGGMGILTARERRDTVLDAPTFVATSDVPPSKNGGLSMSSLQQGPTSENSNYDGSGSTNRYIRVIGSIVRNPLLWRTLLALFLLLEILFAVVSVATDSYNSPLFVALFSVLWFDAYAFRKTRMTLNIVPRFVKMLILFALLVLALAIFAEAVYHFDEDNHNDGADEEFYGSFQASIWTIFLIITSTGFPTQILPSYQENRESILFFIVVVTAGAFLLLNLILLVVYAEFESGKNITESIESNFRSLNLQLAFEIIDKDERGYLEYQEVEGLLEQLYDNFSEFRVPTSEKRRILVSAMDVNANNRIALREFSMILDITRIKLRVQEKTHCLESCFPGATSKPWFLAWRRTVENRFFPLFFDIVVLTCMCVEFAEGATIYAAQEQTAIIDLGFMSSAMVFEVLCKMTSYGELYFKKFDRILECFLGVVAITAFVFLISTGFNKHAGIVITRIAGLSRLCLSLRDLDVFFPKLEFKKIAKVFLRVGKRLGSLSVTLVIVALFFCGLGVALFGGKINRDPDNEEFERIEGSRYGEHDYWPLNFNDILSGLMTLICILHISDWDVITEGFTSAVDSKYARIYFSVWYCVGVLLLLNIVKSVFMRGFFTNIKSQKNLSNMSSQHQDSTASDDDDTSDEDAENESTKNQESDLETVATGGNPQTEYSVSFGTLKFLPMEDRLFLQNRIQHVINVGKKFGEF